MTDEVKKPEDAPAAPAPAVAVETPPAPAVAAAPVESVPAAAVTAATVEPPAAVVPKPAVPAAAATEAPVAPTAAAASAIPATPTAAAAPKSAAPAAGAVKPPAAPPKPPAPVHKGPVARVVTNSLTEAVVGMLGDKVEGLPSLCNEATLKVKALADLPAALAAAKANGADYCSDITSANYPKETPAYEIVYHLYSIATQQSLRIKARLNETEEIPSAVPLWPGANWMEREIFDLMGLKFSGHPDLRRILTPEEWDWHPLRKEFNRFGPDWVNKLRGGEARARYDERGIHYAKATAPEAFIEEPPAPKPTVPAKPAPAAPATPAPVKAE